MDNDPPSPDFLAAFRQKAAGALLRMDEFVELALYHPQVGYYTSPRMRVGRVRDADFYTAHSLGRSAGVPPPEGTVWGRLVASAARRLHPDHPTAQLVEVGVEHGNSTFENVNHGFASLRSSPLGIPFAPPDPGGVLFANEVLDAQPFRRLVARYGSWLEVCVAEQEGVLSLVERPMSPVDAPLPVDPPDGFTLDLPLNAVQVVRNWSSGSWSGSMLLADYGLSWPQILERPAGTARAYHRHRSVSDLLASPGKQDLTCHICWDWIACALRECGFDSINLYTQESFIVKMASQEAETILKSPGLPSERFATARQLQHLMHPAHMGNRFQVLTATR